MLFVLGALVLMAGLASFLWPPEKNQRLLRLKIVRQTEESGNPAVVFRAEATSRRRTQIIRVERVIGDRVERALVQVDGAEEAFVEVSEGFERTPATWAPSRQWQGRTEFVVLAPTNTPNWKLRVMVRREKPNSLELFKDMPGFWSRYRHSGTSFFEAARIAWNFNLIGPPEQNESDVITNAMRQR